MNTLMNGNLQSKTEKLANEMLALTHKQSENTTIFATRARTICRQLEEAGVVEHDTMRHMALKRAMKDKPQLQVALVQWKLANKQAKALPEDTTFHKALEHLEDFALTLQSADEADRDQGDGIHGMYGRDNRRQSKTDPNWIPYSDLTEGNKVQRFILYAMWRLRAQRDRLSEAGPRSGSSGAEKTAAAITAAKAANAADQQAAVQPADPPPRRANAPEANSAHQR